MLLPRSETAVEPHVGALQPWPPVLVTWGPGIESRLHAHHCWHLIVSVDNPMQVREGAGASPASARALVTRPDAPHAVDARGSRVIIVFVDPESEIGERLAQTMGTDALRVPGAAVTSRLRGALEGVLRDPESVKESTSSALSLLGAGDARPALRHPAIRRVLRHLRSAPPDVEVSLTALAALARLSPSRFMHAFTDDVGIPLRPYLRWLKLERAASAVARGAGLSEAAHAAGFSDAAHMTRTFRQMLGVTPSQLRRSQSIQAT